MMMGITQASTTYQNQSSKPEITDVQTETEQMKSEKTKEKGLFKKLEQISWKLETVNTVLLFGGMVYAGFKEVSA